jgi:hypothetical protein
VEGGVGVRVEYTKGDVCFGKDGEQLWKSVWIITCRDKLSEDPGNLVVTVDKSACVVTITVNSADGCGKTLGYDIDLAYPILGSLLVFALSGCIWIIKACLCSGRVGEERQSTSENPTTNETSSLLATNLPTFINDIESNSTDAKPEVVLKVDESSDPNEEKENTSSDTNTINNNNVLALSDAAQAALLDPEAEKTCKICFERKINCALLQCGHTTCAKCAAELKTCPFCRKPIVTRVKLYY